MAATCVVPAQANMWAVGSALVRRLPLLLALQAAALVAAVVVPLLRNPPRARSNPLASPLSLAPPAVRLIRSCRRPETKNIQFIHLENIGD